MAKMGISTIQSYRGAQIFEAVGLNQAVIDKYFTWTPSRIEGVGWTSSPGKCWSGISAAFPTAGSTARRSTPAASISGATDGEDHLFNPQTIHKLQKAVRTGNYKAFKEYSALVNEQSATALHPARPARFQVTAEPMPIEEVESVEAIMKRFKTGAMCYGSISKEAHEALAIAMNRIGGKIATPAKAAKIRSASPGPTTNGDSKNSAIKQVASGRFGVTSHYLVNAKELQIKMAQGAKPGEGGQLPGAQGLSLDRQDPPHHAGRRPHFAAAAS